MNMTRAALCLALIPVSLPSADVKVSVAGANIKTFRMKSESLGAERDVNILLPVDYDKSTRRYPALYLLHGLGDDHTAWSFMTNLSGYAAKHQMIVVMPDVGRSWYINSAIDPRAKFEDFVVKDLPALVDSSYRTIPLPRARAVAGLSMGGYGAALIGVKHYKRYAAFASFSGAVGLARSMGVPTDARRAEMDKLFGPQGSPERAANDPFALLEKMPAAEQPLIYLACGGQDFLIAQNRDFVKLLAEKKIAYEYREISPRGHTWDLWDDHIRIFMDRLATLPGW